MSRINWTRKAVKQLGRLNKADQPVIYDAVQELARMPAVPNVKRLVNHAYGYRLRVRQVPRPVRLGRRHPHREYRRGQQAR